MSVKQLQTRIEQLSVDIERQKEVLKQLECNKRATQRQLNDILDPVARLPLEISSEIFIQCLPARPKPGASRAPMLLLNICNAWTDIALATPALWSSIHVEFPRVEGFDELLGMWLKRARNRPLSISLHNHFDAGVGPLVRQHAHLLKNLEIYCDENNTELSALMGPFPLLTTLTIGCSPDADDNTFIFSPADIRDILRFAPNLVECTFDNLTHVGGFIDTLVLPSLRRLDFKRHIGFDSDDGFLRYLTLPSLETLTLFMLDISTHDLVHFLERSSPPLQKLTLAAHDDLDLAQLEKCLRLSPTITHFQVNLFDHPQGPFFAALAGYLSHFLPNLHTMAVHIAYYEISPTSYDTLFRALSVRRTQIGCLELIWSSDSDAEASQPSPNICASFRQLVADGMKVHIGTEDCNYISV
ncbi:hypothetical protein C8R44DRAFT_808538 [Mycena epipterygia]|nr:hypothetical protein C8R44DRAFT_808538 [Mycena epipterygia]